MANRKYKTLPSSLRRNNSESSASSSSSSSPHVIGAAADSPTRIFGGLNLNFSNLISGGIHFLGQLRKKTPSLSPTTPTPPSSSTTSSSSTRAAAASAVISLNNSSFSSSGSPPPSGAGVITAKSEQFELTSFHSIPLVTEDDQRRKGEGHEFVLVGTFNPTWCDHCGELIWGLYDTGAYRCKHCNFTCHEKCRSKIRLDCTKITDDTLHDISELEEDDDGGESTTLRDVSEIDSSFAVDEVGTIDDDKTEKIASIADDDDDDDDHTLVDLKGEVLLKVIEAYNAKCPSGQETIITDSGGGQPDFSGFIRVSFNLSRPINVISGTKPPSIYDVNSGVTNTLGTLTSFYLPPDTVKALHVNNKTTTQDVIRFLLAKFRVADNPHKYALYERGGLSTTATTINNNNNKSLGRIKMRRLGESECPLVLALLWTKNGLDRTFVLQENDPGEIDWESFSFPELKNFLLILDREEAWYKKAIHEKYESIRAYMEKLKESKKDEQDRSSLL